MNLRELLETTEHEERRALRKKAAEAWRAEMGDGDSRRYDPKRKHKVGDKNLEAVKRVLKHDRDIPVHWGGGGGHPSDNLAYEIPEKPASADASPWEKQGTSAKGAKLFYVSINPPDADVEAFVYLAKDGRCSYLDLTTDFLVVDDVIKTYTYSETKEAFERWIQEFEIERGTAEPGAIAAYREVLLNGSKIRAW